MKNYFLIILALLLSACSAVNSVQPFDQEQARNLIRESYTTKPAHQMVALNLPQAQQWDLVEPDRMLPQGETTANWRESIRTNVRGYNVQPAITAKKFMQSEVGLAQADCREVKVWLLAETKQFVLYRAALNQCYDGKNQVQVTKIFNGMDGVYLVRYAARSGEVAAQQWALMLEVIRRAQLVRNSRYH
jgi:hypothetical protein